jgi:SSS family solute:Na+ symporter
MTAVIWTDVIQMVLYVGGAILSFFVILDKVPGGWPHILAVAAPLGKLQIFDFGFSLTPEFFSRTYNFWAGLIGGCFLTTASHGTEQLMVQRLLAARSQAESRLALFASWAVIFFQFSLFLIIGLTLFVYYRDSGTPPPVRADTIYPAFIWNHLPPVVSGLVIAAILAAAMSNLSAALNSLASTTVMDFWKPLAEARGVYESDSHWLAIARRSTLLWGAVLFAIALVAQNVQSVLEAGLGIASVVYGSLLGVFLLGVLTRRATESAAMAGMAAGLAVMLYVRLGTGIAWTWYVLIGTSVTFLVAIAISVLHGSKHATQT